MAEDALLDHPAAELAAWMREGRLGLGELAERVLARIRAREPEVKAFAFFDEERFRRQVEEREFERRLGRARGALFGVPVGVKDVFDTRDMPTAFGTRIHEGRQPLRDAWVVARLREEGAIIAGKTVTAEMAALTPGPTRHPRDPARTPGGSSMGSAAAVAAGMVPLAVGTQTNGSVIRPAAFCGVYGFKPSFGLIPRTGCLMQADNLDHVGVFGRSIAEVALLAEVLCGFAHEDPATVPRARPRLVELAGSAPPVEPKLAWVPGPGWQRCETAVREGFREIADVLGERLVQVEMPRPFADAVLAHRIVWTAEMAYHFQREYAKGPEGLSDGLRAMIEEGMRVSALDYRKALGLRESCRRALAEMFEEFDAILTPAALGEAPSAETTGDPICCTWWTFVGAPALSLPLLEGEHGLPVGVQLVGEIEGDGALLRTARWLEGRLAAAHEEGT